MSCQQVLTCENYLMAQLSQVELGFSRLVFKLSFQNQNLKLKNS